MQKGLFKASPESDFVVKSNQLVKARINWTKVEHRVVAMLIAQLKKEDDVFDIQRVYVRDIIEKTGSNSEDLFGRAEDICKKLLDQKVHVRIQRADGRRVYRGYNCMSMCEYVEGSGYIRAKFNDDMRPFLLQLKERFTMYRLENFMRLTSQYSMRIYELLKMREGLRFLRVSVDELREMLACEHTYERFSDFKRRVLETARTELEETCDLAFTYTVERESRKPVRVNFSIRHGDEDRGEPIRPDQIDDRTKAKTVKSDKKTPEISVYAMVMEAMTQEEINQWKERDIRTAVVNAERTVREKGRTKGRVNQALEAYKLAIQWLRASN